MLVGGGGKQTSVHMCGGNSHMSSLVLCIDAADAQCKRVNYAMMVVKTTCGVHVADMKYCDVNTSLTIAGLADSFQIDLSPRIGYSM